MHKEATPAAVGRVGTATCKLQTLDDGLGAQKCPRGRQNRVGREGGNRAAAACSRTVFPQPFAPTITVRGLENLIFCADAATQGRVSRRGGGGVESAAGTRTAGLSGAYERTPWSCRKSMVDMAWGGAAAGQGVAPRAKWRFFLHTRRGDRELQGLLGPPQRTRFNERLWQKGPRGHSHPAAA